MTRRPSASQALAMKAAALASRDEEHEDEAPVSAPETIEPEPALTPAERAAEPKRRGRPKGRRTVAARQTIYLDDRRHAALARIAESHGRSVHSLILEGIDHVIGKPKEPGWR